MHASTRHETINMMHGTHKQTLEERRRGELVCHSSTSVIITFQGDFCMYVFMYAATFLIYGQL